MLGDRKAQKAINRKKLTGSAGLSKQKNGKKKFNQNCYATIIGYKQ